MAAMDLVGYLVMRAQLWYNLCLHGVMSSNMQEHVMSRQPMMYGSLEARFDLCSATQLGAGTNCETGIF